MGFEWSPSSFCSKELVENWFSGGVSWPEREESYLNCHIFSTRMFHPSPSSLPKWFSAIFLIRHSCLSFTSLTQHWKHLCFVYSNKHQQNCHKCSCDTLPLNTAASFWMWEGEWLRLSSELRINPFACAEGRWGIRFAQLCLSSRPHVCPYKHPTSQTSG